MARDRCWQRDSIMQRHQFQARRGFTMLELVVVVAIILAISAYAIPNLLSAAADYKLKNTMAQVAGILQQQRIQAVRTNATAQVTSTTITSALPKGVSRVTSGAPNFDTSSLSSYVAQSQNSTTIAQFNARGLPCATSGSACSNWDGTKQVGFLIYFKMDKTLGGSGWGAITITPAGRINTWFYSGSRYQKM